MFNSSGQNIREYLNEKSLKGNFHFNLKFKHRCDFRYVIFLSNDITPLFTEMNRKY